MSAPRVLQAIEARITIPCGDKALIATTLDPLINPKRVIRRARYQSRPPGGGPVQRARFQKQKAARVLPIMAKERTRIIFVSQDSVIEDPTLEIDDLGIEQLKPQESVEEIIYSSDKGPQVMKAYKQIETLGERNFVLGGDKGSLAKALLNFADGAETDFIVWNCAGFEWKKDPRSRFPKCEIVENSNESMALYYAPRIREIAKILVSLSKPEFTILLPSNEVDDSKYERLGIYSQPAAVRLSVLQETKAKIDEGFRSYTLQPHVTTWSEFLQSRGLQNNQSFYSSNGSEVLRQSPKFPKIKEEMLKSARAEFGAKGMKLDTETLLAIQTAYYSMYVGEGVAFDELARQGRNIIILNFEEMRVPQLEYLGAQGNITIITPAKAREIKAFYDWKNKKIAYRNEKLKGRI